MKSAFIIPTGPPEAPCVEKWFRTGISIPSKKNLFSLGPPPLIITSLRYAGVEPTPGNDCITLEISRLLPGLLSISFVLIVCIESGDSIFFSKGLADTSTSSRTCSSCSNFICKKGILLLLNIISEVIVGLYPMYDT